MMREKLDQLKEDFTKYRKSLQEHNWPSITENLFELVLLENKFNSQYDSISWRVWNGEENSRFVKEEFHQLEKTVQTFKEKVLWHSLKKVKKDVGI